jgi:hypothetical protein
MKKFQVSAIAVLALLMVGYVARAEDANDAPETVTLQGQLMCGHCTLKEGDKCNDVLMVKDGDKEIRYTVVLTDATKDAHTCKGKKNVKVTGTVVEKDGANILTATKVEKVEAAKEG